MWGSIGGRFPRNRRGAAFDETISLFAALGRGRRRLRAPNHPGRGRQKTLMKKKINDKKFINFFKKKHTFFSNNIKYIYIILSLSHTHKHTIIYIYIYICVCVCMCIYIYIYKHMTDKIPNVLPKKQI
jgi:hypothetical protein